MFGKSPGAASRRFSSPNKTQQISECVAYECTEVVRDSLQMFATLPTSHTRPGATLHVSSVILTHLVVLLVFTAFSPPRVLDSRAPAANHNNNFPFPRGFAWRCNRHCGCCYNGCPIISYPLTASRKSTQNNYQKMQCVGVCVFSADS